MRFVFLFTVAAFAAAQNLSVKWDELTAADFVTALHKSQNTCVLPFGIIEKHGPHLPLGNDLINVRWAAEHGAESEYSIDPLVSARQAWSACSAMAMARPSCCARTWTPYPSRKRPDCPTQAAPPPQTAEEEPCP